MALQMLNWTRPPREWSGWRKERVQALSVVPLCSEVGGMKRSLQGWLTGKGKSLRWKESREVEAWKSSRRRAWKAVSGGIMVHSTLLGEESSFCGGRGENLVRLSSRENEEGKLGTSKSSSFKEYPVHLQ